MNRVNPRVSILLAVYKPNERWLIEQLISLNNQSYNNLELYIYDDCPEYPLNEELLKTYITKFKYELIRGEKNKGSTKAFEELTKIAEGDYFAYCDQDDIWEENKICVLIEKFKNYDTKLVLSDLSIINETGDIIAKSIRDIRKRIVYKRGNNLAQSILTSNYITGCAMMVRSEIAKSSVPFEENLVHDQWIGTVAALNGKIDYIDDCLIRYRQHESNQTGTLKGVYDKESYYKLRIIKFLKKYKSLKDRLGEYEELKEYFDYNIISLEARKGYFLKSNFKDLKTMLKYSKYYRPFILLEVFIKIIPEFMFKFIIGLGQKGIL
ncbi:glycosyltransferase [Clostridium neonatale]|uniref:glycosyltransferase n=1 Tax=Clostridium neonatale TaxID=137838 RepID=UPI00291B5F99|nr:rhamnosyltransferase [Clostridium neonatale]CAI3669235.1 rhamnosyltransferase [Clostridium neonatale]CAI3669994.1 rhamnosyltransferase [Clostridium neonatale]CAI3686195.1 rhamnosyltransferase [Clostridium neonatale]CAI3716157.1 rhamnosyltransferase [Clostridium neonatale]